MTIYGGVSKEDQANKLRSGKVDIIVSTTGRTLDHLGGGILDLSNLKFFVIDEADQMLKLGF